MSMFQNTATLNANMTYGIADAGKARFRRIDEIAAGLCAAAHSLVRAWRFAMAMSRMYGNWNEGVVRRKNSNGMQRTYEATFGKL